MAVIAFDVDGCLQKRNGKLSFRVTNVLKGLYGLNNTIVVWSDKGELYARYAVKKLKLEEYVHIATVKGDPILKDAVDICFDDEWVKFGTVNILVDSLPPKSNVDINNPVPERFAHLSCHRPCSPAP